MLIDYRIIPVLLLRGSGVVKTVGFRDGRYIGDALNAVSIFNEKMVDEIFIADIDAGRAGRGPAFAMVGEIATECFMPLTYAGGVGSISDIERLLASGVEKVALNSAFAETPDIVEAASRRFGTQSIVVSIDYRLGSGGKPEVFTHGGTRSAGIDPVGQARRAADAGAGELVLQCIDRDGARTGYDIGTVAAVAKAVPVPVVALGGARDMDDLAAAIVDGGAAAAAAGSMFVYYGRLDAVLINVPTDADRAAAMARALKRRDGALP